jgi:predicted nucleic acid-binding protein
MNERRRVDGETVQSHPRRIFLDTNVFIVGAAIGDSAEATILDWAGFGPPRQADVVILASDALFQQIARVARRLRGRDWAGAIIGRIWRNMQVDYVLLDDAEIRRWEADEVVPRADVTVYLTVLNGRADCLVSANHELVKALASQSGRFECLTPPQFVAKYLMPPVLR